MKHLRWFIGRIILLLDFIFSPKKPKLDSSQQQLRDEKVAHLALYQLPACPFCVKVRREMRRQGFNIQLRNINEQENYQAELIAQGGKRKVPCLRIDDKHDSVTWLYESTDIVNYLRSLAPISR
ncbi:glutaredoxin family protein [Thalassotalea ganghwensis]